MTVTHAVSREEEEAELQLRILIKARRDAFEKAWATGEGK